MTRQPTMEDVAREAECSRALVSIVFRGASGASEAMRRRVFEAAERIGYRHNLIAARLASTTTRTLGVFVFDMRNDLTADVFEGIQREADARGIGLVTGISDPSGRRDETTMRELQAARVDAILLVSSALPGGRLRELSGSVPAIAITRHVEGLDSVVADDHLGACLLTEHLLALGHERIAMLAPAWRPNERVKGFEETMMAAGLTPQVHEVGYDAADVRHVARNILARSDGTRPTALLCHNDMTAYEVLDTVDELGLQVPMDVAVTGYDNLRPSARRTISLTSVDQHAVELGTLGVVAACERLDDTDRPPGLTVLTPELVVRGSSSGRHRAEP